MLELYNQISNLVGPDQKCAIMNFNDSRWIMKTNLFAISEIDNFIFMFVFLLFLRTGCFRSVLTCQFSLQVLKEAALLPLLSSPKQSVKSVWFYFFFFILNPTSNPSRETLTPTQLKAVCVFENLLIIWKRKKSCYNIKTSDPFWSGISFSSFHADYTIQTANMTVRKERYKSLHLLTYLFHPTQPMSQQHPVLWALS